MKRYAIILLLLLLIASTLIVESDHVATSVELLSVKVTLFSHPTVVTVFARHQLIYIYKE